MTTWVNVLVDCPGVDGAFTYGVPLGWAVQPGDLVQVPFGQNQVGGIVLSVVAELPEDLDPDQVRPLGEILSHRFFSLAYWQLLERVSHYYYTSLIQVLRTALPPGLLQRSQRRIKIKALPSQPLSSKPGPTAPELAQCSPQAQRLWHLLQQSPEKDYSWRYLQQHCPKSQTALQELLQKSWVESYLRPPLVNQPKWRQAVILVQERGDLTPRQQEILTYVKQKGGECWQNVLLKDCKTTLGTLKTLATKGCISLIQRQQLRLEQGIATPGDRPKPQTPDQARALDQIQALTGTATILLHGVTGSGKTEVYLQAIAPRLGQQQSVLVLVPEIGLTPQLTDRFRARFGDRILIYHSALSDGERYDTWRYLLMGEARLVIGTRSAVFLPLQNLGLIILDEEHDGGYKQDQPAPCYHARTVAQWRSQLENCPLILGSATPSLDTWHQSQAGQAIYLSLPERVHGQPLPPIEVIDMRQEFAQGNRSIFSKALQGALGQLGEKQEQGLLFIHRRGHSTFVSCRSCGYVMDCPYCSVSLTYHLEQLDQPAIAHQLPHQLRCHYCNFSQAVPPACPACGSPYLKQFGSGTQRVSAELTKHFPHLRQIRFDSDTTRKKGAHRELLHQFAQGEADVMVGTQMLTKGIDLPQVSLVGILTADGLLNLPDYRASERTFQVLTQVAGRSGRGERPGRVILQTYAPEHPVIQAVQQYQWHEFAEQELASRQPLDYPPWGQLILLRLSSLNENRVAETAKDLGEWLQNQFAQDTSLSPWQILGPAPATVGKIAQRYRWQILLKSPLRDDKTTVHLEPEFIARLRQVCPKDVRLSIDVEPQNFL
ncbi:primosomal protein N' [Candidatus Synechococcus calcipolaris G9]|uniref:Replication restart protein PriA n=1 Tax=Candidatus Synechococcus calcipolaris G9 TaxID=1497997 RepID=A0ABT6F1T4_9SYNE|nr:primosomal protein N' [Candidatus Synechococcus calcipolaris]MDG2991799.1 primosomal protein N' [Candidatus Synechococcus calcipolaris G9]